MSETPITTVAAIIVDRSGGGTNVLLTLRGHEPFAGQWCIPGGHLDPGESWLSAIRREVKEETGIEFQARFFGSFAEVIPERQINAVVKVFDGAGVGEAKADGAEVTRLQWFALEEALELPLAFRHNEILRAYADGARSEWREGLLAEYKALRDESIKRIELRQQALTLALTGAGVFVGAVVGKIADPLSVLLFPWLVSLRSGRITMCALGRSATM
jgi:8-oxo-dGTP diphosphatase